ncbi:MAG: helix-turn-helix domain-containing protein [Candidatus Omnitrophica bacterium]|nr:helix-turn-helix domain-containing protein [Candidatus Omnitrophota bacterium]
MKRKSHIQDFGKRLAQIRKAKGVTQAELGNKIGVSQRVIAYYEKETTYPATHLLIPIAKVLKVSVDELLGIKQIKLSDSNHARFLNKLKKAEVLSKKDKTALLHYIDALLLKIK